jgi:hypothetical protein
MSRQAVAEFGSIPAMLDYGRRTLRGAWQCPRCGDASWTSEAEANARMLREFGGWDGRAGWGPALVRGEGAPG